LLKKGGPLSPDVIEASPDKTPKKPLDNELGTPQVINYETFESSSEDEMSRCIFES